jgi:hypothetical protein
MIGHIHQTSVADWLHVPQIHVADRSHGLFQLPLVCTVNGSMPRSRVSGLWFGDWNLGVKGWGLGF